MIVMYKGEFNPYFAFAMVELTMWAYGVQPVLTRNLDGTLHQMLWADPFIMLNMGGHPYVSGDQT